MGCGGSKPKTVEIHGTNTPSPGHAPSTRTKTGNANECIGGISSSQDITIDSEDAELVSEAALALDDVDRFEAEMAGGIGEAWSGIAHGFAGQSFELRLTMPVELIGRCVLGCAIQYTRGTDIGHWVEALGRRELSQVHEGASALRSAELKTAGDELKALLRDVPILQAMSAGPARERELAAFTSRAATCQHDADVAFHKVGRVESIRSPACVTMIETTKWSRRPSLMLSSTSFLR
jgi:hypothetical protein